jgi:hypothetical protein
MRPDEFDEWFAYHTAAFPGIATWLAKNPESAKTLQHWLRVLGRTSLAAAKAATDAMLESGDRTPPYERHPAIVRRMAAASESRSESDESRRDFWRYGETTYRCPHCEDSGIVSIHAAGATWETYSSVYGDEYADTVALSRRCVCPKGDAKAATIPRFEPKWDRKWEYKSRQAMGA